MLRSLVLGGLVVVSAIGAPLVHESQGATPQRPVQLSAAPALAALMFPMNSSSCYYANCTEARQAGETNIPASSPHYCSKLDRDGDGIACES